MVVLGILSPRQWPLCQVCNPAWVGEAHMQIWQTFHFDLASGLFLMSVLLLIFLNKSSKHMYDANVGGKQ